MKKYLYETHCHTNVSSRCSRFSPEEIVKLYTTLKYDGVFITDHCFHEHHLTYEESITLASKGYYEVKKLAQNTNLKVFFGIEFSRSWIHFLVYGLSPKWHMAHPEIANMSTKEALNFYRENGATVLHAHPFRAQRGHLEHIELYPECVDGAEIINGGNHNPKCKLSTEYVKHYKLLAAAGCDIHSLKQPTLGKFISKIPLNVETDYGNVLKMGKYCVKKAKNPFADKRKNKR